MIFSSLLLQLLLIVQPPEHVALFSHCHASQCVFANTHLPKHTNTLSLTRLQATFLLMHTRVTSTEMNHLLIRHDFELRTPVSENLTQGHSSARVFVRHLKKKKNCFKCWEQNLFGSNKTYGSIARASRVRICIVGSLTGIPIRKASLIFFKSKEVLFL